jgi:hypothetical protein
MEAFFIGKGFVVGAVDVHESFGLTLTGVVRVLGAILLVIVVDRFTFVFDDEFESLEVKSIDCRRAGLTISYDGC